MINGTLLVQVIHFAIAYSIIDRLFLRAAVEYILQERKTRKKQQDAIIAKEHSIDILKKEKRAIWLSYQEKFLQRSPYIERQKPSSLTLQEYYNSSFHAALLDSTQKEHAMHEIKNSITRWVLHG